MRSIRRGGIFGTDFVGDLLRVYGIFRTAHDLFIFAARLRYDNSGIAFSGGSGYFMDTEGKILKLGSLDDIYGWLVEDNQSHA